MKNFLAVILSCLVLQSVSQKNPESALLKIYGNGANLSDSSPETIIVEKFHYTPDGSLTKEFNRKVIDYVEGDSVPESMELYLTEGQRKLDVFWNNRVNPESEEFISFDHFDGTDPNKTIRIRYDALHEDDLYDVERKELYNQYIIQTKGENFEALRSFRLNDMTVDQYRAYFRLYRQSAKKMDTPAPFSCLKCDFLESTWTVYNQLDDSTFSTLTVDSLLLDGTLKVDSVLTIINKSKVTTEKGGIRLLTKYTTYTNGDTTNTQFSEFVYSKDTSEIDKKLISSNYSKLNHPEKDTLAYERMYRLDYNNGEYSLLYHTYSDISTYRFVYDDYKKFLFRKVQIIYNDEDEPYTASANVVYQSGAQKNYSVKLNRQKEWQHHSIDGFEEVDDREIVAFYPFLKIREPHAQNDTGNAKKKKLNPKNLFKYYGIENSKIHSKQAQQRTWTGDYQDQLVQIALYYPK